MPNTILCATVNVRSLLSEDRYAETTRFFRMLNIDILLVQESRLLKSRADFYNAKYGSIRVLVNPNNNDRSGGVAVLINPLMVELADPMPPHIVGNFSSENYLYDDSGRFLVIRLSCANRQLNIGNVYLPSQSAERSPWLENISQFLLSLPTYLSCDLLGGDWNMVTNTMDHTSKRPLNFREKDRLLAFLSLLNAENQDLVDGYRVMHPDTILYTHKSHNSQARLDQIYCSPVLLPDLTAWKTHVLPKSLNLDHMLVAVTLSPPETLKLGPGRFRFKCSLIKSKTIE